MAKLLQFTGVLVLFACSLSLASGEPIEIPDNACFWRGGKYGQMIYCDTEEIAIGACGSGKSDDCDKSKKLHARIYLDIFHCFSKLPMYMASTRPSQT